jgi:hypothetical protein
MFQKLTNPARTIAQNVPAASALHLSRDHVERASTETPTSR